MEKPVLVVMAAGMGSRYGGLKQIDPVDAQGNLIMDFSIYDAIEAGFEKVYFVIKKENESDFREVIGDRISEHIETEYVFQDLYNLPEGYEVPEGRKKPWGTGHALMSCYGAVHSPMAVINADDYYGKHAFSMAYDYLSNHEDEPDVYSFMMVGYLLENTLTDNGDVARGICRVDEGGNLLDITERTHIRRQGNGAAYTENGGASWISVPEHTTVSLNMWGFTSGILDELNNRFPAFLDQNLKKNPLQCEYFLPTVVDDLLKEKKAKVRVLQTVDQWYGVTYRSDKPSLSAALQKMKDEGVYPQGLWN